MKKFICILSMFLLLTISAFAQNVDPRYAVGMVSGFNDNSSPSAGLNVTSIVPSPINTIEHKFSALWVAGQNCPPGQPCYDVMQRVESGYSMYGQNLHKSEVDSHTTGNRQPQVEHYRIS